MVASRTQAQAQTETQYQDAIAQANKDAQQSAEAAANAEQVSADVQRQLTALNQQYTARQVSADDYQSRLSALRNTDRELAKTAINYEARAKGMTIYASGRPDPTAMQTAAATTNDAVARIKASEVAVSNALGAMPAAPAATLAPVGA